MNIRAVVVRLLLFAMLVTASHVTLIALAATASPALKATIRKYSNVPIGIRRDHMTLRFEELQRKRDIDVLFIGSSHSLRTFDPRYFERHQISAFNLGTANQTPLNTYYLLQEYLDQLKPRVVVIEVYWGTLAINAVEGTIAITVNRGPGWDTVRMALATHHPMVMNAQLSSYFEGALGQTTAVQLARGEVYTSGGFVESRKTNEADAGRVRQHEVVVDPAQMKYLSRVLTLLQERHIKALFVWAPVTSGYLDAVTNLEDIRSQLMDVAQTHAVPFVDLNHRVALDDRLDFFDRDHLNQDGVEKVMPVFADVLREFHLLGKETGSSGTD